MRFRRIVITIFLCVFFLRVDLAFARRSSDFSFISKGRHFDIYASRGVDVVSVLLKLDYQSFHPTNVLQDQQTDLSLVLAQILDVIYAEVSDILDIHIYSYRGEIRLVPNREEIARIFRRYTGSSIKERAFYSYELNAIYVSAEDFTLGVLGHEIAHAIISHYFVVPPSMNVQEILCGYVDFTLRRRRSKATSP